MIHVDVNPDVREKGNPNADILVQTSVDGAVPWKTQYVCPITAPGPMESWEDVRKRARDEACSTARVFVNGCRFAGAEVRATAFGYAL